MPTVLAASRMVVPKGTLASMPSMVTVTEAPMASGLSVTMHAPALLARAGRGRSLVVGLAHAQLPRSRQALGGAAHDLVAEVLEDRQEGAGAGLPEAALGGDLHRGAERLAARRGTRACTRPS